MNGIKKSYLQFSNKQEFLDQEFLLLLHSIAYSTVETIDLSFLYDATPQEMFLSVSKQEAGTDINCTQDGGDYLFKNFANKKIELDDYRLKKGLENCFKLKTFFNVDLYLENPEQSTGSILYSILDRFEEGGNPNSCSERDRTILNEIFPSIIKALNNNDFEGFYFHLNKNKKFALQFMLNIKVMITPNLKDNIQNFLTGYIKSYSKGELSTIQYIIPLEKQTNALFNVFLASKFNGKVDLNRFLDLFITGLEIDSINSMYKQNRIENFNTLLKSISSTLREVTPVETLLLLEEEGFIEVLKFHINPELLYARELKIIKNKTLIFPWIAEILVNRRPQLIISGNQAIKIEDFRKAPIDLSKNLLSSLIQLIRSGEKGINNFDSCKTEPKKVISDLRKKIKFKTISKEKWIIQTPYQKGFYKINSDLMKAYIEI